MITVMGNHRKAILQLVTFYSSFVSRSGRGYSWVSFPGRRILQGKGLFPGFGVLFCLFFWTTPASAITGNSEEAFVLDGSLRTIGGLFRDCDFAPFYGNERTDEYFQSLLRITGAGRPWGGLSYEVHLVQTLTYFSDNGEGRGSGGINLAVGKSRYRAMDEASAWWGREDVRALLWLDRVNVKLALDHMDLTIGRQAITFGKAHFWNPLDVYLPFDPNQFDRDYKAGVDALRTDIPLGDFSGITLVGVLGRGLDESGNYADGDRTFDASWYGSSALGRFFTNMNGWDMALQGGKIYGGYQLGGGMVGDIKGVEVRAEAAYFQAHDSPAIRPPLRGDLFEDQLTAVIGLGRRFESSLILEIEYLYNGGGESDDLNTAASRLERGTIQHLGRHLAGFRASYEFAPLLNGQLAGIYSLSDHSFQIQASIILSLSDNADLLVGSTLNIGKRPEINASGLPEIKSEFGSYPNSFFVEFKVYF